MNENLIEVENASKKFCRDLNRSLRYGITDVLEELIGRRKQNRTLRPLEFWAVKDVSFALQRGECLAIMGRNGAGKSTLLKLIIGRIKLDAGMIRTRGNVAAIAELGAGFNYVQTGRENIYNAAAVHGLTRKETNDLYEQIVGFSGISHAIDSPVKNYSYGMRARLSFAVTAHLNPDILIVDEALAVGDMAFRRKCLNYLRDFRLKGGTMILVSHDLYSLQYVCTRSLVLEEGVVTFSGEMDEGVHFYLESVGMLETTAAHQPISSKHAVAINEGAISPAGRETYSVEPAGKSSALLTDSPVVISSIDIRSCDGEFIETGCGVEVTVGYHTSLENQPVRWSFMICTGDGIINIASGMNLNTEAIFLNPGEGWLHCKIPNFPLLPGNYCLKAVISTAEALPLATKGWQDKPHFFSVKQIVPDRESSFHSQLGDFVNLNVIWE